MPTEPEMDIFDRLKASEPAEWSSYVDRAFVRQMATGSFPKAAFQTWFRIICS
jgi:thiaminase (transcriptional activator TenA)